MKISTAELHGAALDWAVMKAEGPDSFASTYYEGDTALCFDDQIDVIDEWHPSLYWDQGGQIIERERIDVRYTGQFWGAARQLNEYEEPDEWFGPSPLVAAMRCYVASKLGAEVDVPEEVIA